MQGAPEVAQRDLGLSDSGFARGLSFCTLVRRRWKGGNAARRKREVALRI
jgi:hypothetical protein